jgi:hypothetical protein
MRSGRSPAERKRMGVFGLVLSCGLHGLASSAPASMLTVTLLAQPGKPWPKRCAKKPLYLPPIIPQGGWRGQRNIMYFMVCPTRYARASSLTPHKMKLCSIVHLAPASMPPRFGGGKRQLLPEKHTG